MNPVLRELQRQLNDIAKQLDALQRQETVLSNPVTYSGTPTAGAVAYWTGAGTVAHASFGTVDVVLTSGDQTIEGAKTFSGTASVSVVVVAESGIADLTLTAYRESSNEHARYVARAARGTFGAPSALTTDTKIMTFGAAGYHSGTAFSTTNAVIDLVAAENWTSSANGTYLVLYTTETGATVRTERVRIGSDGLVTFANDIEVAGTTTVNNIRSLSFTMADDELVDLVATYGIPDSCMLLYTITNTVAGYSSIVGCRALASGYCEVVGTANAANLTVGTTELTNNAGATPGTDGDVNISASSNGKIIIKNRLGGNRTFNILVVG